MPAFNLADLAAVVDAVAPDAVAVVSSVRLLGAVQTGSSSVETL